MERQNFGASVLSEHELHIEGMAKDDGAELPDFLRGPIWVVVCFGTRAVVLSLQAKALLFCLQACGNLGGLFEPLQENQNDLA